MWIKRSVGSLPRQARAAQLLRAIQRVAIPHDRPPHRQLTRTRSLPQAFTEKFEVRGVNPMLVRKKAKAYGIVLYGIVLGVVLALPGCNANWPAIGSKAEQEALCRLPGHCAHSTPSGANHSGE